MNLVNVQFDFQVYELTEKCSINVADVCEKTSLHNAHNDVVAKALIECGANVSAVDNDGRTPLFHAANRDIVRTLLEPESMPNAVTL